MNRLHTFYHIPEIKKIGCCIDLEGRIKRRYSGKPSYLDLGYKVEPLITIMSSDEYAGEYERKLQILFGYKTDCSLYHNIIKRNKAGDKTKGGKVSGKINGKIQGKKNVESGQLASIQSAGGKVSGKKNVENGRLTSICSIGGKIGGKMPWFNNDIIETRANFCPPGFKPGRTKKKFKIT